MPENDLSVSWLLIIITPIIFVVLYMLFLKWTARKGKALRGAVYISTPFLVFAVRELMNLLLGGNNSGWVIVSLLVLVGVSLYIQYRTAGEMKLRKTLTSFLRLTFFVFVILYIMLLLSTVAAGALNV
ncbi:MULTISPECIES: DUF3397 family protein [Salimicrobium]|uniref:DUF3397 domain-containing protein n=2 Tax=Salimicrobium TaxID=351195 RepID=K2H837_9BACI|nr:MULTISPECIES: DUF3397 family protein [Salimicrobium]AKG04659.1 hypothetical protein AAV35_007510 [Salimicrobium jeotgali]EKE31845.1 hypothetical protein MJ3_06888 [Salimicrobium jeotgali]MBM7696192.1 phosphoglycerol transferase MdoB-like AlkP superfamily enzyme [Salimicrobium jeotgali]SDX34044.1 Protein of unknown function [Salimicrobium album]